MNRKAIQPGLTRIREFIESIFQTGGSTRTPGNFTPYFQYRIGKRQNDWHLYFRREPFARWYYNECFNRIAALSGSDIYRFIGFHYERYPDKTDFTRFLRYELTDRLRQKLPRAYRDKLLTALHWVTEAEGANQAQPVVTAPSNSLHERMEALFQQAEEKLYLAVGRLPTGSIELNNRSHEDKLIQCLILLKEVTAPAHVAKSEQLFKRISDIDIATILHLHVEHFRDKKIPTIQKTIGQLNGQIRPNHPKVRKLTEALREFFYE